MGDIVFVGDTYETRQEYGFKLVLEKGESISSVYGPSLILDNKQMLEKSKIKYNNLLNKFKRVSNDTEEYWNELWYGAQDENDIIEEYLS